MPETYEQRSDGTWKSATPLGWQPGIDIEVSGVGPYRWQAFERVSLLAEGTARTRLGLAFACWRIRRSATRGERP